MTSSYLEGLDALLALGLQSFSEGFRGLHAHYVLARQQPDGGFPARHGPSDLYYTDFGLRVLLACGTPSRPLVGAGEYLTEARPRNVVECFAVLNAARMLAARGHEVTLDRERLVSVLSRQALPDGGFARPGGQVISAYHTFIAALCYQLLDLPLPQLTQAEAAMRALQVRAGGFRESAPGGPPQTNATAAALTFLTIVADRASGPAAVGESLPPWTAGGRQFLLSMQAADGGLRAHRNVPGGDLLSTFTGMLTLALLGGLEQLDLPAAGRFVRGCMVPGGGFGSCPSDPGPDVEYTYYGLGCLAILAAQASARC